MIHGKRSSYNRGCRCMACCQANTEYIRANRTRKQKAMSDVAYIETEPDFFADDVLRQFA